MLPKVVELNGVWFLAAREDYRFGSKNDQPVHLFAYGEFDRWVRAPTGTITAVCGAELRPDYMSTTSFGPNCPNCQSKWEQP